MRRARPIDRFMRWVFWVGATGAMALTATVFVWWLRIYFSPHFESDRVTAPIQETDSAQATRGAAFYRNAADALDVQLKNWGFTPVTELPSAGKTLPLLTSQKTAWYGMTEDTRTRIWVCVALAREGKGLSVWMVWPPPGLDSYIETTALVHSSGIEDWWRKYLTEHAPPSVSSKGR
jgi:hypothetical protein